MDSIKWWILTFLGNEKCQQAFWKSLSGQKSMPDKCLNEVFWGEIHRVTKLEFALKKREKAMTS